MYFKRTTDFVLVAQQQFFHFPNVVSDPGRHCRGEIVERAVLPAKIQDCPDDLSIENRCRCQDFLIQ